MQKGISYDSKSFIINGKRTFLTSGSIHYFRVPRELWRDRLIKAKDAGLNTIQLYVPWNFHEPEEGKYDFTGRANLPEFLDLCEELKLWVVARPGPYICAEWDFGGLPPWLMNQAGIRLRSCNPVYLRYVDRWFEQLMPVFGERQVTRGGNIILMQIENELNNARPEDAGLYMNHLRNLVRKLGIEVPLITCAGRAEGTIECINSSKPADSIDALRKVQPDAPVHSTEFWPGWYTVWSQKSPSKRPAADVERETWRMLANGAAGYNYYMWHGGANFDYSTMYLQVTEYDLDSPLSPIGGLTDKYHACRKVARFAQAFSDVLTEAEAGTPENLGLKVDGADVKVRTAPGGSIAFLHNTGERKADAKLALAEESLPSVPLDAGAIRPVVLGYDWEDGVRLAYSTAAVFDIAKYGRERVMVLYGRKNEKARLQFELKSQPNLPENSSAKWEDNRLTVEIKISAEGPTVETFSIGQKIYKLIFVSDDLLSHTFITENGIVVGPYFARTQGKDIMLEFRGDEGDVTSVAPDDIKVKEKKNIESVQPPKIKNWSWRPGGAEVDPDYDDSGWIEMGMPVNRVFLQDYQGYGWYRTAVYSDSSESTTIHFKGIGDRAIVFVENKEVGVVEAPPEDRVMDPAATFNIRLSKGRNVIAVLTENLGHVKGPWQINRPMEQDRKGIFDDVIINWDKSRKLLGWRFRSMLGGERRGWTDGSGSWKKLPKKPDPHFNWYRAEFELSDDELIAIDRPLLLRMDAMNKGVVWVNGHNLGRYWMTGAQRDYYVPKPWLFHNNTIVIFEEGKAAPTDVKLVRDPIHAVMEIRKL